MRPRKSSVAAWTGWRDGQEVAETVGQREGRGPFYIMSDQMHTYIELCVVFLSRTGDRSTLTGSAERSQWSRQI